MNANINELEGIEGVLQAYTACLDKIQLYGPTYFNEIIQTAASAAMSMANNENEQNYVILYVTLCISIQCMIKCKKRLIITDGIINDMKQTVDAVVNATELPLSIIIVGVGNADFSAMDKLDADDEPLRSSNGKVMKRDIVQFVPFNEFAKGHISTLAKAVLEEVPDQITSFMSMKKLHPLQKQKKNAHLAKQGTMNNIYEGPSSLVQQNTLQNMYPNLQQQNEVQQQQQQQGPPPTYNSNVYAQQQLVQQQAYNPNYNANQNAPSAPNKNPYY